jgi:type IV pilus assembly protein PilX
MHPSVSLSRLQPRQRGTALIMALVFLVLLTILGLKAMDTTALEEKMTSNTKDKNIAFESAETALTFGENWLYGQISRPQPFTSSGPHLFTPSTTDTPVWDQSGTWSSAVVYPGTPYATASGGLAGVAQQPEYIIEDMGTVVESGGTLVQSSDYQNTGNSVFRVTALGYGATGVATAELQSVYAKAF